MSRVYLPSCKPNRFGRHNCEAELIAYGMEHGYFGRVLNSCCKGDLSSLRLGDEIVYLCGGCRRELEGCAAFCDYPFVSVFDLVYTDKDFAFPDHSGKKVLLLHDRSNYGEPPEELRLLPVADWPVTRPHRADSFVFSDSPQEGSSKGTPPLRRPYQKSDDTLKLVLKKMNIEVIEELSPGQNPYEMMLADPTIVSMPMPGGRILIDTVELLFSCA